MTYDQLLSRIETAKDLDFCDIFNKSIELFKKVWVQGLIIALISMAITIPLNLIGNQQGFAFNYVDGELLIDEVQMTTFGMISSLVVSYLGVVVSFGLHASFFRICKAKDLGEVDFDDYFHYFKQPYAGKLFGLSAIVLGIAVVATMLCVLPIFYVMVPLALMNVMFAFNPELSSSDMVNASFKLGNKKWLITFGLLIVAGLLAVIVGLLLCGIGVLVTSAFAYIPLYYIYKESIGFEGEDAIDSIGENNAEDVEF